MKFNILILIGFLFISSVAWANSAPVVSNVSASQRGDDSKRVDIHYDLADADGDSCTVWIVISDDGGATWDVPAYTLSGDIGSGKTPGTNKHIIWDAGHDIVGKSGNFAARVFADDGNGDDMVLVTGGEFKYDGSTWVYVGPYFIDKNEVTNQRYCEYLNVADPTGQHWDSRMEITRHAEGGPVYYLVQPERENYPIRYVNYYDAEAYAAWKSSSSGLNYHLPDQYQWVKAAGWDPIQQKLYAYGFHMDTISCTECNYNNCVGSPIVVGSYDPYKSYYGCYDMSGNVFEWTTELQGSYRVLRGGYWGDSGTKCIVTYRWYVQSHSPAARNDDVGFRLVLNLD